jgi:phosphate transport system substrate-binding protein
MKKNSLFLALIVGIASIASSAFAQVSLSGAGSTFVMPFHSMAFEKYTQETGVKVSYGAVGSGAGINSLKDKVVDFGASDGFLSDKEMAAMPAPVVHIPTCSGAVVVAFNLPGVEFIKLAPNVLADIMLGNIKNWNAASLKKLNPSVKFPDLPITVVYRSDGSGTTAIYTDYLTKVSKEWADKVGSGKSVKWLTGIGAKGNPGVAGTIGQTKGAIGYVGSEYSFAQNIPTAYILNKAGKFIKPTLTTVGMAGKTTIPADTRIMLTNSDAPLAYPIAGFTWILIYKEQNYNNRSLAQATATLKLLDWMLDKEAQNIASTINYVPLSENVVKQAKAILRTVTYGGKPILK